MMKLAQRVRRAAVLGAALGLAIATSALAAAPAGHVAADTPWRTPYYVVDSGVAGPTVMVTGGVHGDEPAGAAAAEQIAGWRVTRGRLIVVPRVNIVALTDAKRKLGVDGGEAVDLNRVFPTAADGDECGHPLAAALWSLVTTHKPDWLLDLHEGYDFHRQNSKSVGASVIHRPTDDTAAIADAMIAAADALIDDADRRFVLLRSGPVKGSLAYAAGQRGIKAAILETCKKDQRPPVRIRQHRAMVATLLGRLDMIDDAEVRRIAPAATDRMRVALFDDGGVGGSGVANLEKLLIARNAVARRIDSVDVRYGALDQFDLLIVSGGSASREAASLDEAGRDAVRRYVDGGGGYVGICAGAYLATAGYSWSLRILDANTQHTGDQWKRGKGRVQLEMTDAAEPKLAAPARRFDVLYANGPIIGPAGLDDVPDYTVLARFATELAENGSKPGLMLGSPAIVAGTFGRGRVVVISPHPEASDATQPLVADAIRHAAARPFAPAPTEAAPAPAE